jgi:hypothetical protein
LISCLSYHPTGIQPNSCLFLFASCWVVASYHPATQNEVRNQYQRYILVHIKKKYTIPSAFHLAKYSTRKVHRKVHRKLDIKFGRNYYQLLQQIININDKNTQLIWVHCCLGVYIIFINFININIQIILIILIILIIYICLMNCI